MKATLDRKMTLGEHIDDFRKRMIRAIIGLAVGVTIAFVFGKSIFSIMFYPLAVATGGQPVPHLYFRSLPEPFTTYFRVCLIVGCFIAGPYILYQLWMFIGSGLLERERRIVRSFVLPAIFLFLLGVTFFFIVISPYVVRYFLTFGQTAYPAAPEVPGWLKWITEFGPNAGTAVATSRPAGGSLVEPWLTLDDYISFTAMLSLLFGAAFQMPLVVIILVRVGILPLATLKKSRKYVFFAIVVIAAIITPTPDVVTMMAMALPMYILYEVGLLFSPRHVRPLLGPAQEVKDDAGKGP